MILRLRRVPAVYYKKRFHVTNERWTRTNGKEYYKFHCDKVANVYLSKHLIGHTGHKVVHIFRINNEIFHIDFTIISYPVTKSPLSVIKGKRKQHSFENVADSIKKKSLYNPKKLMSMAFKIPWTFEYRLFHVEKKTTFLFPAIIVMPLVRGLFNKHLCPLLSSKFQNSDICMVNLRPKQWWKLSFRISSSFEIRRQIRLLPVNFHSNSNFHPSFWVWITFGCEFIDRKPRWGNRIESGVLFWHLSILGMSVLFAEFFFFLCESHK